MTLSHADRDRPSPLGPKRALVAFEHREAGFPLRLLHPRFRHCICLIGDHRTWVLCDPVKTRIELTPAMDISERDLIRTFAGLGATMLRGSVCPDRSIRPVRLRAVSCVEVVKRVLNLDLPWVLTPLQLYRALLALPPPLAFEPTGIRESAVDIVDD